MNYVFNNVVTTPGCPQNGYTLNSGTLAVVFYTLGEALNYVNEYGDGSSIVDACVGSNCIESNDSDIDESGDVGFYRCEG